MQQIVVEHGVLCCVIVYRATCDELRTQDAQQFAVKCTQERGVQLLEVQQRLVQEFEEESKWAKLWEWDRLEKLKRGMKGRHFGEWARHAADVMPICVVCAQRDFICFNMCVRVVRVCKCMCVFDCEFANVCVIVQRRKRKPMPFSKTYIPNRC